MPTVTFVAEDHDCDGIVTHLVRIYVPENLIEREQAEYMCAKTNESYFEPSAWFRLSRMERDLLEARVPTKWHQHGGRISGHESRSFNGSMRAVLADYLALVEKAEKWHNFCHNFSLPNISPDD